MGAEAIISVIAQSHPKDFSDISLALSEKESANRIHYKLYDFIRFLYSEGNL